MENKDFKNKVMMQENMINHTSIRNNNQPVEKNNLEYNLKLLFPTLSPKEYEYAIATCKAFKLNPLKKEIYFVPFQGKNGVNIAPITSYEVYARELNKSGNRIILDWKNDDEQSKYKSLCAKANVYNNKNELIYKSPWIYITEYAKFGMYSNKTMWDKYPSLMLEKCILVRICRMILGMNMGYTAEEMSGANNYNQNKISQIQEEEIDPCLEVK